MVACKLVCFKVIHIKWTHLDIHLSQIYDHAFTMRLFYRHFISTYTVQHGVCQVYCKSKTFRNEPTAIQRIKSPHKTAVQNRLFKKIMVCIFPQLYILCFTSTIVVIAIAIYSKIHWNMSLYCAIHNSEHPLLVLQTAKPCYVWQLKI